MSDESEDLAQKTQFVKLWLKEADPFKAAMAIYPDNLNRALWVAHNWPKDEEVLELKYSVMDEEGEDGFLPSKADLAKAVWDRMQGTEINGVKIPTPADDFAKLAKLYAEVRGFIEKPKQGDVNVAVIQPKVIEVPNYGTNEEWEIEAQRQQRELLSVSRSKH